MRIIVLLGPPGCGKGTQAEILESELGLKKLSTGDMLRDIAKQDSPLSTEIKTIMNSGGLVSDELIIKVIEERIAKYDCKGGIILDGFPRTLAQARHLEKLLLENSELQNSELNIISIEVNDISIVKRISGRFSCSKCLSGYHDEFKPTTKPGICDKCGSTEFTRRKDDNKDTVKKRLDSYYNDTAPIIDFYEEKKMLNKIDGEQNMKKVFEDLRSYI